MMQQAINEIENCGYGIPNAIDRFLQQQESPHSLLVKRLSKDAKLPTKAYEHDAGYDLYSLNDVIFKPGVITEVSTGIALAIPPGHVGLIWDKSSFGAAGIKIFGGVIDSGYRGEIKLKMGLMNTTERGWVNITAGSKITQILIQKVEHLPILEVNELPSSDRGEKGFGSSGK